MKEQVIAARPRRAAVQGKGFVQRPNRRDGSSPEARSFSLGKLFNYVPTALKVVLAIVCVVTLFVGYRVASSASMFQVHNVDVVGASRTSAEEIQGLVRRGAARSGVWRADLSALSAEIGRLPGVRRAVITRVLPDRLRVRITERVPIAVVRTAAGHFVWVDEDGVALGEMKATDQLPPFFIRGWSEDGTSDAGKENSERVQKYLEAAREWQAVGLAERVSEINLIDVHDVRAQLAGKDSDIEVRLGSQDLGQRLKTALGVLDEYKQTPRGSLITYVELQGDRVMLGFSSGGKVSTGPNDGTTTSDESAALAESKPATNAVATVKKPNTTAVKPTDEKKPRTRAATDNDKKPKEARPRVQ